MAALFFRINCLLVLMFSCASPSVVALNLDMFSWDRLPKPEQYQLDMAVTSINFSEPVTLKANFDDWKTEDFRTGTRIYSKHVARFGIGADGLTFGHSTNLYYFLNFSADTARLHYLDKNNRLDQQDEPLDLFINANNARGDGLYVGYTHQWRGIEVGARVNYLQLNDIMFGEAEGYFDPGKALTNNTSLMIDYAYTEDRLFDRDVPDPTGRGFTIDLSLKVDWRDHLLQVQISEAYSRLKWKAASGSYVEGSLSNLQGSEEAAIRYQHFRGGFSQYLPVHQELRYSYRPIAQAAMGFEYETLDRQQWSKIVATWHAPFQLAASIKWAPDDSIWGLHLEHPNVVWILESDSANYNKSRYLKFSLQGRLQW